MTKILTTIILSFLLSASSFGQVDKEYSATLSIMFEVSGTNQSYQVVFQQMFAMFRQLYANVDEEAWSDLEKEFNETSTAELTEMLVPVYAMYLTLEDIQQIIIFYESPVGKKYAEKTPLILKESMQVGQDWGLKVGRDFEKKMKAKGY